MTGVKGQKSGFAVLDKETHRALSSKGGSRTKADYKKAVHKRIDNSKKRNKIRG